MIEYHKPLVIPIDFFKKRKVDGVNADGSEILVSNIINNIKGNPGITRGDAQKGQPDYFIGDEWVEVTYAETKAQKLMAETKTFKDERSLKDILESIMYAIENKVGKKYSVSPYSVAILNLVYCPTMYKDSGVKTLDNIMFRYIDDFYRHLFSEFIEKGLLKNIYLIFIDSVNNFAVIDINELIKNDGDILYINCDDKTAIPYLE